MELPEVSITELSRGARAILRALKERVILVQAEAGWGKSTAVRHAIGGTSHGWCDVGAAPDEPGALIFAFARALSRPTEGLGEILAAYAQEQARIIGELAQWRAECGARTAHPCSMPNCAADTLPPLQHGLIGWQNEAHDGQAPRRTKAGDEEREWPVREDRRGLGDRRDGDATRLARPAGLLHHRGCRGGLDRLHTAAHLPAQVRPRRRRSDPGARSAPAADLARGAALSPHPAQRPRLLERPPRQGERLRVHDRARHQAELARQEVPDRPHRRRRPHRIAAPPPPESGLGSGAGLRPWRDPTRCAAPRSPT